MSLSIAVLLCLLDVAINRQVVREISHVVRTRRGYSKPMGSNPLRNLH